MLGIRMGLPISLPKLPRNSTGSCPLTMEQITSLALLPPLPSRSMDRRCDTRSGGDLRISDSRSWSPAPGCYAGADRAVLSPFRVWGRSSSVQSVWDVCKEEEKKNQEREREGLRRGGTGSGSGENAAASLGCAERGCLSSLLHRIPIAPTRVAFDFAQRSAAPHPHAPDSGALAHIRPILPRWACWLLGKQGRDWGLRPSRRRQRPLWSKQGNPGLDVSPRIAKQAVTVKSSMES